MVSNKQEMERIEKAAEILSKVPDPDGSFSGIARRIARDAADAARSRWASDEYPEGASWERIYEVLRSDIFLLLSTGAMVVENLTPRSLQALRSLERFLDDEQRRLLPAATIAALQGYRENYPTALAYVMARQAISQRELARRCGVKQPTVQAHVSGRRIMRSDTLKKYAEALGVEPGELLD